MAEAVTVSAFFAREDILVEVRINKFLSEAGVCSRREADRQIEAGNVTIDGRVAQMGDKVEQGQTVCFQGQPVSKEEEMVLIAFHKPVGIVCTAEKREKNNVIDYINYPKRIYPIGRLDKDSEGLLLLTNNGEIVNKMMRSGNMHEKEYIVTVNKPVTDAFVRGMAGGVPLVELNTTTRKCLVQQIGKRQLRIVLTQGLNRQIRRMCEYFGYRVQKLVRVRIMNIELGDLRSGQYRDVTPEEYKRLTELIAYSSNQPVRAGEKTPRDERPNKDKQPARRRQGDSYDKKLRNRFEGEKRTAHRTGTYRTDGTDDKKKRITRSSRPEQHGTFTIVNKNIDRENRHGRQQETN